jgi:hypothetical protein
MERKVDLKRKRKVDETQQRDLCSFINQEALISSKPESREPSLLQKNNFSLLNQ